MFGTSQRKNSVKPNNNSGHLFIFASHYKLQICTLNMAILDKKFANFIDPQELDLLLAGRSATTQNGIKRPNVHIPQINMILTI